MRRALREITADCTFLYNRKKQVMEFSEAAVEQLALPRQVAYPVMENLEKQFLMAPEDNRQFFSALEKELKAQSPFFSLEGHLLLPDKSFLLISIQMQCIYDEESGAVESAFGSLYSMQKLIEYTRYLNQTAMRNGITFLPNRAKFKEALITLMADKASWGHLVFIDIRDFKEINGTYSHNIGDKVLYETARLLEKLADEYNVVYNYAVDQFLIIVEKASKQQTRLLMESIYQYFYTHTLNVDGIELRLEFSMVAVEYAGAAMEAEDVMVDLDIAMQMIKYDSEQSYGFFDANDKKEILSSWNFSQKLKKDVEEGFEHFFLLYQPLYDRKREICIGVEALLRWKDDNGTTSPEAVVPVLEAAGLMPQVEEWIFNTACKQCSDWISQGAPEDFIIHINASPSHIGRQTLIDEIESAIEIHHLEPENVVLEITESSTIQEMRNVTSTLSLLRGNGIKIAIDDFGTGYSSLSYLSKLEADVIKIDRSFVSWVDKEHSSREFLAAIVNMAKSMGFAVCVEGVERPEEREALRGMPVDYMQGYYFGKPMAAGAVLQRLLEEKQKKTAQ